MRRAPSGGGAASPGRTVSATRRPSWPQKTVVTVRPPTVSVREPTGVQPAAAANAAKAEPGSPGAGGGGAGPSISPSWASTAAVTICPGAASSARPNATATAIATSVIATPAIRPMRARRSGIATGA